MKNKLLAIVPARGGSKAVPNKPMQDVGGKPLILRTLETVTKVDEIDQVFTTSDSYEIQEYCRLRDYPAKARPTNLAGDNIALFDVARHLVESIGWTGDIAICQPTCPNLTPETLRRMVKMWQSSNVDWLIGVTPDYRIYWRNGQALGRRVNRQQRKPLMRETGAVQFMSSRHLKTNGGGLKMVVAVPEDESLDVDTMDDLLLADARLRRRYVHLVVIAGYRVGTGHYHRSISLAKALRRRGHSVTWEWRGKPTEEQKANARGVIQGEAVGEKPDVVVFDSLSPEREELVAAKRLGSKILVLEDEEKTSSDLADKIINEMCDSRDLRYSSIRSEFHHLPKRKHKQHAQRVLLTFGGTDPTGLTEQVTAVLDRVPEVYPMTVGRQSMANAMRHCDIVITSRGRTVYEAAMSETPCISIAANKREGRHIKLPGVTYIGKSYIRTTLPQRVVELLGDRQLRQRMATMAKQQLDTRGIDRLVHEIEGLAL